MDPDNAELLAAVDAGIADASPSYTPPEPTDESDAPLDDASDEGSSPEADGDTGADDGVRTGGEVAAPADADKPADSAAGDAPAPVGPDGKPVVADAAKPDGVKPADPLNDPLPNALKKETKERFNTIIGMVKETTTKLEATTQELQTVKADRDGILDMITQTRATPQQYTQALDYIRKVNSNNRADKEELLAFMQGEVAALATQLGKPVPGVNMLEGHVDLIQEVGSGRLSPERATEIAAARNQRAFEEQRGQVTNQHVQQQQRVQQERQQARQDMNALGLRLKAADPAAYAVKAKVLIASLKETFARIPPSTWVGTFERAYNAMPTPAAPAAPRPTTPAGVPASGGGNQPLRASNPAGGQRSAPATLADAIDFGIADARR
jgi:hypothetical protein